MKKKVENTLMNKGGEVLATANDRLIFVGGQYDRNGWFLAAQDTRLGTTPINRIQVWVSENGVADVYVGTAVYDTLTAASRKAVDKLRTSYGEKSNFAKERKLAFRGEMALEGCYVFLSKLQFKKTVTQKSDSVEGVA